MGLGRLREPYWLENLCHVRVEVCHNNDKQYEHGYCCYCIIAARAAVIACTAPLLKLIGHFIVLPLMFVEPDA
jgi:hypothetical protein